MKKGDIYSFRFLITSKELAWFIWSLTSTGMEFLRTGERKSGKASFDLIIKIRRDFIVLLGGFRPFDLDRKRSEAISQVQARRVWKYSRVCNTVNVN